MSPAICNAELDAWTSAQVGDRSDSRRGVGRQSAERSTESVVTSNATGTTAGDRERGARTAQQPGVAARSTHVTENAAGSSPAALSTTRP